MSLPWQAVFLLLGERGNNPPHEGKVEGVVLFDKSTYKMSKDTFSAGIYQEVSNGGPAGRGGAVPPPEAKRGGREGAGHLPRAATAAGWAAVLRAGHQRADSVVMRSLQNTHHRPISQRSKSSLGAQVARGSKVTPPGSSTADAQTFRPRRATVPPGPASAPHPPGGCRWRLLLLKSACACGSPRALARMFRTAHAQRPRQEPVTTSFPGQRVTRAAGWEVGGASDRRDGLGWKPGPAGAGGGPS